MAGQAGVSGFVAQGAVRKARRRCAALAVLAFVLSGSACHAPAPPGAAASDVSPAYPESRRSDVVETLHGIAVADPWRWLENDVRQDRDVAGWVGRQNTLTDGYLAALPDRERIRTRLTALWDFEKFSEPTRRGTRYFFRRNDGLQSQAVLYVQEGLTGAPRVLLDPNTWAADGATALDADLPSPDGKRLLYSVQDGGSDWRVLRVVDVDTGAALTDEIRWVKFSNLAWAADGSGFWYSRYPVPAAGAEFQSANTGHSVYFHRLGEPQSADRLVYSRPDRPELTLGFTRSDDGRWLVITASAGTDARYEVVAFDLSRPGAVALPLVSGFDNDYELAGTQDGVLLFRTDRDAPRSRVVAVDTARPAPAAWREILPESPATLVQARVIGGLLVARYLEDAKSAVRVFGPDGAPRGELALPGPGSVEGLEGDQDNPETFYRFSSFNRPETVYRLDVRTLSSSVFRASKTSFDPADYTVEQRFYTSKDGTRVPIFIAARRDLPTGKPAPLLLYGYGGFNIPVVPAFSIAALGWMEMGGIYAVANLRGGGEYGKAWHDAGRLANKQNVFDDFISAGEYLVREGRTTPGQLAINGRSNGGLLVGAVVNQRPDLFAAALPGVGVMDMLRFNRFTAGRFWTDDYGDPANASDFAVLRAYSPYHNIRSGQRYPAILVTTADTDDRVVPGHSFKYTAALQSSDIGPMPHLIRIDTRAGHGAGKPTGKRIAETADQWAFIARHTGLRLPQGY